MTLPGTAGETEPVEELEIQLTVNGRPIRRRVAVRRLLVDFLRDDLGLTGTHVGCEQGICGACTVVLDGVAVRSCIMLAVQSDDSEVTTVEGLTADGSLNRLQQAFKDHHGLQCGFCTPGFLMTLSAADPAHYSDEASLRQLLSGNICRCTGYQNIVAAVRDAWSGQG